MPRPERRLDSTGGPVAEFAAGLRRLRVRAGSPGYPELARRAHYSATTLSEAAGGRALPTLPVALAYVAACGGDQVEWEARWRAVAAQVDRAADRGGRRPDDDSPQPYRGLAAYQPADAEWFFGRTRLVRELLDRLCERRFLAVFGPSGVGKSSLLRAGVLPAVRDGALSSPQRPGNECAAGGAWPAILMTPGAHPLRELAIHLAALLGVPAGLLLDEMSAEPQRAHLLVRQALHDCPPPAELLLVVDQFEEIFIRADPAERASFIAALLATVEAAGSRARVVLGVRADFYPDFADHPELVAALRDAQVLVGAMTGPELREAVTRPAEHAGLMVEAALVSTIVAEVADRPGALPLASHALLEAWRRRRGTAVTLAGYQASGGVEGAIGNTAEDVYASLDDEQRRIVRTALLRMIEVQPDGAATVRRAERREFDEDPATAAVLQRLADRRLLVLGTDTVGIAHEALLRAWPRLRDWLEQGRDGLRIHRQLTQAVSIWESLDRDPGTLYRGAQLAAASSWADDGQRRALTGRERDFLDASERAYRREISAGRRRLRLVLAGLSAVAIVLGVLASVAVAQANRAMAQRDVARAQRLAASARAQLQLDPELALLLARQSYQTMHTPETEAVLRQATAESRVNAMWHTADPVTDVAFSPDGRQVASSEGGEDSGAVRIRDWNSGAVRTPLRSIYLSVAFSPDGRGLGAAGVELLTGVPEPIIEITPSVARPVPVTMRNGDNVLIFDVAFCPDGRLVGAGDDGTVRVWDNPGAPPTVLRGHQGPVRSVAFSPDGRRLASAGDDGTVRVWDMTGRRPPTVLRGHEGPVRSVAFSPDGRRVASGGANGTIRIWDAGAAVGTRVFSGDGGVFSVAFSPDGRRLASAGEHGTILIWDTAAGIYPLVLRGHKDAVRAVVFSPDGLHVASGGDDRTVRVWDTDGRANPEVRLDGRAVAGPATLTADGRYAAVARPGGIEAVNTTDGVGTVVPTGQGSLRSLALSADGGRLATVDGRGLVRVVDAGGRVLAGELRCDDDSSTDWRVREADQATAVAISADGGLVAAVCTHSTVRVWSTADPRVPPLVLPNAAAPITFSPDGLTLASGSVDPPNSICVWHSRFLAEPRVWPGTGAQINDLAFSSDGGQLAAASNDGRVKVVRVDGEGRPVVLSGHPGGAAKVAFSRDGKQVASLGSDGTIRVWKNARRSESVAFAPYGSAYAGVAFSSDGQCLVTTHSDGAVRIWQCEVCGAVDQVLRLADKRVTRRLTAEERGNG